MENIKLYNLSDKAEYYLYNPITDYFSGPLKKDDFKLHAKLDVTGKGMEFKPFWVYAGTHYEYQSIYKSIGSNFVRLEDLGEFRTENLIWRIKSPHEVFFVKPTLGKGDGVTLDIDIYQLLNAGITHCHAPALFLGYDFVFDVGYFSVEVQDLYSSERMCNYYCSPRQLGPSLHERLKPSPTTAVRIKQKMLELKTLLESEHVIMCFDYESVQYKFINDPKWHGLPKGWEMTLDDTTYGDGFSTVVADDTYLKLDNDCVPPTDCMSYDWLHRLNHKEADNG